MLYLRPSQPKLLMPVPKWEWRTPSQAQVKDVLGNENRTRFRLTARLNDGHVVWRGWFDDRDDADAFLFALASGSLEYERPLWRLPTPGWHPDLGDNLSYDFSTQVIITSGTTTVIPSDWNPSNNSIGILAGAGSGGAMGGAGSHISSGGGASPYVEADNFPVAASATINIKVGTGGNGVSSAGGGNNGTDTWINQTSSSAPTTTADGILAKAGKAGGENGTSSVNGGAAGATASCVPTATTTGFVVNAGGRGGNVTGGGGANGSATGGGGAGGLNGVGANGVDVNGAFHSNGGAGDAGLGGAAGTTPGGAGGDGTEWTTAGSGGGGAGNLSTSGGGSGGNYGAGGGATKSGTSGAGTQGVIVLTYTATAVASMFNLAAPH